MEPAKISVEAMQNLALDFALDRDKPDALRSGDPTIILFKKMLRTDTGLDTAVYDLPDTVILKVFSYLDEIQLCKVACVCANWRRIAYDSSLWTRVDLRRYHSRLDNLRLMKLVRTRLAPLVTSLNLGSYTLPPHVFQALSKHCPKLTVLGLEGVTFVDNFAAYSNSFPQGLKKLDIRHARGHASAFRKIAQSMKGIECLGLSDELFDSLERELELEPLFRKFENIRVMEFSYCCLMTDDIMALIASYCTKLTSLCLRRCSNVRGRSLPHLLSSCTGLASLVMDGTGLTNSSVLEIAWENTNIREIDLSWCRHLSQDGLGFMLPRLRKLRYLRLCCCGYGHAITDTVLSLMAGGGCTKLEVLDLSYNSMLTNQGLGRFASYCRSLIYLRIHHCKELTKDLMKFFPGNSNVFVVANFPVSHKGLLVRGSPIYTFWPSPVSMRTISLENEIDSFPSPL